MKDIGSQPLTLAFFTDCFSQFEVLPLDPEDLFSQRNDLQSDKPEGQDLYSPEDQQQGQGDQRSARGQLAGETEVNNIKACDKAQSYRQQTKYRRGSSAFRRPRKRGA